MNAQKNGRTASDRILALSATVKMPPYQWHAMRPHCRTCSNSHDRHHRWDEMDREKLRERGAEEIVSYGGATTLLVPLALLWRAGDDTSPGCFLHEVWPEWDGALRGPFAFWVQDMTRFKSRKPLTMCSYSKGVV